MKLRLLVSAWLVFTVAGCSALRSGNPELRGNGVERACSITPWDLLSEEQRASAGTIPHTLAYPLRIGLFFLPPHENEQRVVPTRTQQSTALRAIRDRLLAKAYVEEVVIVPTPFLGLAEHGGFNRIQEIAQRFDFDLVAVVACAQFTHEFRNLRPQGWITLVGDKLWLGDVDQADTFLSLSFIDPVSLRTLTFANGQADWGDSTSAIDDWRSPDYVRLGSFDRALDNLLSNLIGASFALEPSAQRAQ